MMTCLQLCVLFNSQICGTFPPVFMNIFLGRGLPCTNALSMLLFSRHDEFETGLLQWPEIYYKISILLPREY